MLNHIAGEQYQSDFTDEVDPIPWWEQPGGWRREALSVLKVRA
jgi:hypothetical protein